MVIEQIWGIPLERAQSFLASQPDVRQEGPGFVFGSCRITLTRLAPGNIGAIPFPRTQLSVEGPEEEVAAIHRRFLIQFLSAGG